MPNINLDILSEARDRLTKGQIKNLSDAINLGKDLIFKITNRQVGNGIGSIIPSIGIPLLIDALKGGSGIGKGGVRMGLRNGGASPRIGYRPPFIGSWETRGRGKKKNKGKGLILGKNSPFKGIPLIGDIL